jgi:Tat protein translocase TatB subunit
MSFLDPAKLLIIGVVALVVLGPDKLPIAARTVSGLLRDLRRMRASLHDQVKSTVGSDPMMTELMSAKDQFVELRQSLNPRTALLRPPGPIDQEEAVRPRNEGLKARLAAVGSVVAPGVPGTAAGLPLDDPNCN